MVSVESSAHQCRLGLSSNVKNPLCSSFPCFIAQNRNSSRLRILAIAVTL